MRCGRRDARQVIGIVLPSFPRSSAGMTAFRAAVAKGDAQLDRNEGVAYTPELMESMTQTALQDMHTGKPVNTDILP